MLSWGVVTFDRSRMVTFDRICLVTLLRFYLVTLDRFQVVTLLRLRLVTFAVFSTSVIDLDFLSHNSGIILIPVE